MRRRPNRPVLAATLFAGLAACAVLPGGPNPIPVFFSNGSTALSPEAAGAVQTAASLAQQHPNARIQLVGHSLPSNSPVEPGQRALDRAAAVRAQLVQDGVAPERILNYPGGALPPTPDTPVGSRRVDITFTH